MAENLIPEIAKMLGVEMGERFKVNKKDSEIYYFSDVGFLKQVNDAKSEDFVSDLEEEDLWVLYCLLFGKEKVVKLPWEPKYGEKYWSIHFTGIDKPYTDTHTWTGHDLDFVFLRLGVVYRTKEEAEAHLREDYERLTGKKLSSVE